MGSPQIIPDDFLISAFGLLEREKALPFLVQRIVQLPQAPRRVLAMYYHENLPLSEIAPCFGLTECQIDKIRIEAVDLLRRYLVSVWAKLCSSEIVETE
jgi:DNA-directed RNA polymerase specialized sigma subunit